MNPIRLLDFVASAARATITPTLFVRIDGPSSGQIVADRLPMLSEEALAGLSADGAVIVEHEDNMALETAFERIREACSIDCPFQIRIDAFPACDRHEHWSSKDR